MSFTAIDSERYVADSKRLVAQFLAVYLATDFADLFAQVGGVAVYHEHPQLPEGVNLAQPLVLVANSDDAARRTFLNSAETQHYGEFHEMVFDLRCVTDDATGGTLTRDDLVGAVSRCFALHGRDLETAGFALVAGSRDGESTRRAKDEEFSADTGLYARTVSVRGDVQVLGEALRTIELTLGTWTFSATGQGAFSAGQTLTIPHDLRVKCLTGTGVLPTVLTVYGVNQDGNAETLTGTIPATRSAGTYVALTPQTEGHKFVSVTALTVTERSGIAGEAFAVVNIPVELTA